MAYIVQKFKNSLPYNAVKNVLPCLPCNKLAILSNSRDLTIVDIVRDNISHRHVIKNVASACWLTDTGVEEDEIECPALCVLEDTLRLTVYSLKTEILETVYDFPGHMVKQFLDEQDIHSTNIDIVTYRGNILGLRCESSLVVTIHIGKEDRLELLSVLSLNHIQSEVGKQHWRIKQDVLAAFDPANLKLFVYSMSSGSLLAWLDLTSAVKDVVIWDVSEDLEYFCFSNSHGHLVHISLFNYIRNNPQCLKSMNNSAKSDLSMDRETLKLISAEMFASTTLGDWLWRKQMGDLLTKHKGMKNGPWYLINSTTNSLKRQSVGFKCKNDSPQRKHSVTGFQRTEDTSLETTVNTLCVPADIVQGISDLVVAFNGIDIKSVKDGCCTLGFLVFGKDPILEKFAPAEMLLLSKSLGYPHILLSEKSVASVGLDTGQEELVSRVMLYGGAGTADVLCHLNKWDRCAIPINTLETGLKQRQLDTVSFFLKSKENLFTNNMTKAASSVSSSDSTGSFSWVPSYSHEENFAQVDAALDLLIQCVKDSITDPQSRQFAERLLAVTLNHMYGLQADALLVVRDRWGVSGQTPEEQNEVKVLEIIVDKLMSKIGELRKCLHYPMTKLTVAQKLSAPDQQDVVQTDSREEELNWNSMETDAMIETGAVSNRMLQVQQYLWQLGQRQKAGHTEFIHTSLHKVLAYLSSKDMNSAQKLLSSLGFNISMKLWEFVLFSKDVTQREYIVYCLREMSALSDTQGALLEYNTQLIQSYPNTSFTTAQSLRDTEDKSLWESRADVCCCLPEISHDNVICNTGDLFPSKSSEPLTHPGYSQVLIDWLTHWGTERRERILLDAKARDRSPLNDIDPGVLWEYYQLHGDREKLVDWLTSSLHVDTELSPHVHQPLPADALDNLENCPGYITQIMADLCARGGILRKCDLDDFSDTLHQMVRIGSVMARPHPLQDTHYLSQFHQGFLQYCVQVNLPSLMWDYLDYYRLDTSILTSLDEILTTDQIWLPMFTSFYNLSKDPLVPSNMLKASLSNAAYITDAESSTGRLEEDFIKTRPLAAIATALYSPLGVDPLISRKRLLGRPVPNDFEKQLERFPKLSHSLFPASVMGLEKTDVSVYQLLQKGAPFCPTRLFGWQSTNELTSADCMKELPYFSHPDLVTKYAPVIKLRYTYYLRQARPSFAFVSFLAEELDTGTPTISKKRVNLAYRVAIVTALRHLTNSQVVSGCTAFVEMLAEDSSFLRTYAQVAQTILQYKNTDLSGSTETRREMTKKNENDTVDLLISCLRRRRGTCRQVLLLLEEAITFSINKERPSSVSFEAAIQWNLAILFCHQVRLPYSTCFLETCAKHNQWLPFIWFSQIHQFPKEQLHGLLHLFPSRPFREHLHYVIENAQAKSLEMSQKKTSYPQPSSTQRDIRFSLYTRIGLAKSKGDTREHDSSSSDDDENQLVANEEDEDSVSDDEVRPESAADDVFGVVFSAVSSKCQWKCLLSHSIVLRNPLFSVLAASFQESSRLACLSSWLVANMDATSSADFLESYGCVATKWTLGDLRVLVDIFIQKTWTSALATGFDIFQMDSPLLPFLMFYAEFTERKQFQISRKMLESFKEAMFAFRQIGKKAVTKQGNSEMGEILGNIDWFEHVSYSAICHQLTRVDNQYETKIFLGILEQVNIAPVFSFPVPDYGRLHKLYQISLETGINLPCHKLLESGSTEYTTACEAAVSTLKSGSLYDEARKFADIAGLEPDHITVTQVSEELSEMKQSSLWNSVSARHKLWRNCLGTFKEHNISAIVVADFFQSQINECILEETEQAYLYQLSHDCLSESDLEDTVDKRQDIYIKLWRCKLLAKQRELEGASPTVKHTSDIINSEPTTPKTPLLEPQWGVELLQYEVMPSSDDQQSREITLTDREKHAIDELIGELLNEGHISECCKLRSVFNHYNDNLAVILSCMKLAAGVVTVEDLGVDIQALLNSSIPPSHAGRTRRQSLSAMYGPMSRSSSFSSVSGYLGTAQDDNDVDQDEIVVTMEKLLDLCQNGFSSCLRIITAYKISMVLNLDYEDVIASSDFEILEKLLLQGHQHRFTLAKDYLKTGKLTDAEVAGFLSDAIVHSLQVFKNNGETSIQVQTNLIFNPGEGRKELSNLVKLCQDPSVLGDRLLDAVAALAGDVSDPNVLSIQTELLIGSHDCHSLACNMEGISKTLRAARVLTECLARAEEFSLMVRLLTGVGRYSEMSYIFDALKQNHQFELLLRKGMENEARLKVAMLDYLKRFHSTDSDSYTMVALKFTMYREIALMLEECAFKHLTQLKNQSLESSSETKNTLEKIVQYFSDAADSYIKDNCMRHAQVCIKQARLVALQTQLLSSAVQLINLTPSAASNFVQNHNKFTEAYIVSEAYSRRTDWPAALCINYLLNGDGKYFSEFKNYVKLTPSLISETIERFEQTDNKPSQSLGNVRKLLSCCKDLKVRYQLAKDLGLRDLVSQMESGDGGVYLLDVFL